MSRSTVRKAVEWIAVHDTGDDYDGKLTEGGLDVGSVSELLTVELTAHLFGQNPIAVATAVVAMRAEMRTKAALAALKQAPK